MKKKPLFFEAACIFSVTGSAIGFLGMFVGALFFDQVIEKVKLLTNLTATNNLSTLYLAILGTAYAISFIGAVKLYRMQKIGLVFYLIAQAVIMILPIFQLGTDSFSVTNFIFTLIFSGVYLFNYKLLKD